MAQVRQDVAIRAIEAMGMAPVTAGVSNQLGVYIEVSGASATASSATCTVMRNPSETVTLSPSVATAGQVTATLTSGNLTTLNAALFDRLTVFWTVTIASQEPVRLEVGLIVVPAGFQWGVLYQQVKEMIPAMRLSSVAPSGQSNLWPQVRLGLERLRADIDGEGIEAQAVFMARNESVQALALQYAARQVHEYLSQQDNQAVATHEAALARVDKEILRLWERVKMVIKRTSDAWATDATRLTVPVEQQQIVNSIAVYQSGGLL